MKNLSAFLSILILSTMPSFASRHCKQKYKSFAEQIASLSPSGDLDIFDKQFSPVGSLVTGYAYEVDSAHTKGLYSRTDKWYFSTDAIPNRKLNLTEDQEVSINAGVRNSLEATFIRFMKDPCQAMLATPYSPQNIPLKAATALGPQFRPGDYFLFRGSAGFVASAEMLSLLGTPLFGINLSGHFVMEGFYQIHIVRINEKEIRLKIVGHRGRTTGMNVSLGFQEEFDVFNVRLLDKQIERFVNTTPIRMRADFNKSKVFMVDYVLDLTDAEVVKAFESVLKSFKKFKSLNLADPFRKQKDIEKTLLLDVSPLEELFKDDQLSGTRNRIKRNLQTSSEQDTYGFGVNLGNKVIGVKFEGAQSTAQMGLRNDDNTLDKYLLRSWDKNSESRFLYKYSRIREEDSIRALFRANQKYSELEPINVVRYSAQRRNRFSYKNFSDLQLKLKKALPWEVYQDIPWEKWKQKEDETYYNFGFRFEIQMKPEAILEAPELTAKQIEAIFIDSNRKKGLTPLDYLGMTMAESGNTSIDETFNGLLGHMARSLEKALNKKIPLRERLEIITRLRINQLFLQTGLGFIMSLDPATIHKHYRLDINISSNESNIDYSLGELAVSDLYRKILTVKAALDDSAIDLIREAESLSLGVDG